jgi:Cu-Zn family superoxide dismutase
MKWMDIGPLATGALLMLAAACADPESDMDDAEPVAELDETAQTDEAPPARTAAVQLHPTEGYDVRGTVTIAEFEGGVRVSAEVTGLSEGEHGFHIHETGDCSAPDATSAGDHFAPDGSRHGGPDERPPEAHVGDMGNLIAAAGGRASYERDFRDMGFTGEYGIAGRAIVVHAEPDDMESQPAGAAGDRVACGVIPEER